jgi:dCTP deaminase
MLTDGQIKECLKAGKITIDPFIEGGAKAGKYNVHLGKTLLVPTNENELIDPTDPTKSPQYKKIDLETQEFILQPKQFVLGQTYELIGLDADVGMLIDGATTLARIGLSIHQSATFINPGQDPNIITLEIFNAGPWQIKLTNKMRIGRLLVFKYTQPNEIKAKDYSPYRSQKETTPAIFRNGYTVDSIV